MCYSAQIKADYHHFVRDCCWEFRLVVKSSLVGIGALVGMPSAPVWKVRTSSASLLDLDDLQNPLALTRNT